MNFGQPLQIHFRMIFGLLALFAASCSQDTSHESEPEPELAVVSTVPQNVSVDVDGLPDFASAGTVDNIKGDNKNESEPNAGSRCLIPVPAVTNGIADATQVVSSTQGKYLIGKTRVFVLAGTIPVNINTSDDTGTIFGAIPQKTKGPIVVAERGIFEVEDSSPVDFLRYRNQGENTGTINALVRKKNGNWIIGAENGLFEISNTTISRVSFPEQNHAVKIMEFVDGNTFLIGTPRGLYQYSGGRISLVNEEIGAVNKIWISDKKGLIGAQNGLFVWHESRLRDISEGQTGTVFDIEIAKTGILIGSEKGLLQLYNGRLSSIAEDVGDRNRVSKISIPVFGKNLVISERRVFEYTKEGLNNKFGFDGPYFDFLEPGDGSVWVDSAEGLVGSGSTFAIRAQGQVGSINYVSPVIESVVEEGQRQTTRLVLTSTGVFEFHDTEAAPIAEVAEGYLNRFTSGTNRVSLRWNIEAPCAFIFDGSEFMISADGKKEWTKIASKSVLPDQYAPEALIDVTAIVDLTESQELEFGLFWKNPEEKWIKIGKPIKVGHTAKPKEQAASVNYTEWIAKITFAVHTLLFGGAVFLSRWSKRAWRIANDPVAGKVGLWFHFGIRHIPFVQRWVFQRWFENKRAHIHKTKYLSATFADPEGVRINANQLISQLSGNTKSWIQGNSGMGKSIFVDQIQQHFFLAEDCKSLSAAERVVGYVPIVISMRNMGKLAPLPGKEDDWIVRLVAAALEIDGMEFTDLSLLKHILKSGRFCLVLDGANETPFSSEIETFTNTAGSVGLVVTSQELPGSSSKDLELWRLPATISDMVEPLLKLYLGEERGAAIFADLDSTVLQELRSGYDIVLLVDLVRISDGDQSLPKSRIELYEAIIACIQKPDGSPYPIVEIESLSWGLLLEGKRQFDGKGVNRELLQALQNENNPVARKLGGVDFEFRHDQMRSYLAARWIVVSSADTIEMLQTTPELWKLPKPEQLSLWQFVVELTENENLELLYQWSLRRPEMRVMLQSAIYEKKQILLDD